MQWSNKVKTTSDMKTAALFDMDGTLLQGESQFGFLVWCWRCGIAPRWRALRVLAVYLLYLSGIERDAVSLRQVGFELFKGLEVSKINLAGEKFFKTYLQSRIRRRARDLVLAHQEAGHLLALVTSASESVARPFARSLGIEILIATRLKSENGIFTGERELPEPYAYGKQGLVLKLCDEQGICARNSYAYSDHHSDLAFLEVVGHPRVVHPTSAMKRLAGERGWKLADLENDDSDILNF